VTPKTIGMYIHQHWPFAHPYTALDRAGHLGRGKTPFARIQDGYYKVETFGPRLLAALDEALTAAE